MKKNNILFFTTLILLYSCGNSTGSNNNEPTIAPNVSTLQLTITSDEVNSFVSKFKSSSTCSMFIDGNLYEGECITPNSLKAKVRQVNLGNTFGGPPARLIDFAAGPEPDSVFESGPFGVPGLADFDFANPSGANNSYSDDNFQDTGNYFDGIGLEMGAIEVKLDLTSNSNLNNGFWTIRYMMMDQNPLLKPSINSCVTDQSVRDRLTSLGDIYSAPTGFLQGDILVCQKGSDSEPCADEDFQWITASGALTTTRPDNPIALDGPFAFQDDYCSNGGGDLITGGMNFASDLTPPIFMSKTRSTEECLFQYDIETDCTITGENSGNCSGSPLSGFGINVNLDYNLNNSFFVSNTIDLTNDSDSTILQNMPLVAPIPVFFENKKAGQGGGDYPALEATVSISINNSIADSILVARGALRSEYDENFCFIPGDPGEGND